MQANFVIEIFFITLVFTFYSFFLAYVDEWLHSRMPVKTKLAILQKAMMSPITFFGSIVGLTSAITITVIKYIVSL
jgi:hypothetical protein